MVRVDLHEKVRAQLAHDEARCAHFPGLFAHKLDRMRPSPLAFLRGTAPLFYTLLKENPTLSRGPDGGGWIAGDLHLENFGAYRPALLGEDDGKSHKDDAAFDLNDFDDATEGPWFLDVVRLTTSVLLAGRELKTSGPDVLALAGDLLESYSEHACHKARFPEPPRPVAELLHRVRSRTRKQLLDMRTSVVHGRRQFVRGSRYHDMSSRTCKKAAAAFEKYAARFVREGIREDHFEILDLAFRVAGTGSLGGLRVAVLTEGKGGPDGAWIFDMKEQGSPSASLLLGKARLKAAKRVVAAMEACLGKPPRMLGTTKLGGTPMLVRRLAPQEDKLLLERLHAQDLAPLAHYLGALTGAAHRRGAERLPKKAWKRSDRQLIVDNAITLAGLHEAAYLAMCRHAPRRER